MNLFLSACLLLVVSTQARCRVVAQHSLPARTTLLKLLACQQSESDR